MKLISFNKVLGLPVIAYDSGNYLGKIVDLVLDYDTGKFLALMIEGDKVIKVEKIRNFEAKQILVSDEAEEALAPTKIKIKGNKVVTQGGINLGKAVDFEINLNLNKLAYIFVKNKLLGKSQAIAWDQIISIEKGAILVKDEVIQVKVPELELAGI